MKKVLVIAGGTGGHIFPGLAVANALKKRGDKVSWLGSKIGMERDLISDQFDFYSVDVFQLRGKGFAAKLLMPYRLLHAVFQALAILKKIKPDTVISFGGFVAAPGSIAAKLLGIPLIIHEQNARAGLTNRMLAKVATRTLATFPGAFEKATVVGNPIREVLLHLPKPSEKTRSDKLRILVLGGSRGAQALNQAMLEWLPQFDRLNDIEVRHQTGQQNFEVVQAQYQQQSMSVRVEPFISDIAEAFAWADLLICRAGASTVTEAAAVGLPAIFVPLPTAVDNHQYFNAKYLVDQNAARIIEQNDLTPAYLSQIISRFIEDRALLLAMGEAAYHAAKRDAVDQIIQRVSDGDHATAII